MAKKPDTFDVTVNCTYRMRIVAGKYTGKMTEETMLKQLRQGMYSDVIEEECLDFSDVSDIVALPSEK